MSTEKVKAFCDRYGITVSITAAKDPECPVWCGKPLTAPVKVWPETGCAYGLCDGVHGLKYLVVIRRNGSRVSFPFWNSRRASQAKYPKAPTAFDVLESCYSDMSVGDPDEVCEEFGPMLPSRATGIAEHGARLRKVFGATDLGELVTE